MPRIEPMTSSTVCTLTKPLRHHSLIVLNFSVLEYIRHTVREFLANCAKCFMMRVGVFGRRRKAEL